MNSDPGSATRTAAVSKSCGCGGPWWSTVGCDTSVGPYCAQGAALASGTCAAADAAIKVDIGESYLGLSEQGAAPQFGPAKGGNMLTLRGFFVLPSDVNVDGASGILGGAALGAGNTVLSCPHPTPRTPRFVHVACPTPPHHPPRERAPG